MRELWSYDTRANAWSRLPDVALESSQNDGCTIAADGFLYLVQNDGFSPEGAEAFRLRVSD